MSLNTYAALQTSILAYIVRSSDADAIAMCPDWITLAEDELRIKFSKIMTRHGETKDAAFALSSAYTNLPTGFIRARSILLNGNSGQELDYISPQVADRDFGLTSIAGRPRYYTIVGTQIRVMPSPDASYTATFIYYTLPALSVSNTTNWLLTNHPKIYHVATMAEAHNYYKDYDGEVAKRNDLARLIEEMRTTDEAGNQGGNMRMKAFNTP